MCARVDKDIYIYVEKWMKEHNLTVTNAHPWHWKQEKGWGKYMEVKFIPFYIILTSDSKHVISL